MTDETQNMLIETLAPTVEKLDLFLEQNTNNKVVDMYIEIGKKCLLEKVVEGEKSLVYLRQEHVQIFNLWMQDLDSMGEEPKDKEENEAGEE